MLLDIVLAVAPVVVAVPALVALLTTHVGYASKGHLQKRLYGSLLLAEKLPAGTPGARQIAHDIDRQTRHLAYLMQYPHRSREIVNIALIGVGLIGGLVAYYLLLWADAPLLYLLVFLGLVVLAALWFERAMVNFARNDALVRELFEHFGAPDNLVRPRTELVAKAPALTMTTVFERAADVRDAHHGGSMTTPDAVNSVLVRAHSHGAWRRELRGLVHHVAGTDYRARTKTAAAKGLTFTARAYDWLLWHLLRPFFTLRLGYLDDRERGRIARAEKSGDVYKAAWLATHYHRERRRLAIHWAHLRRARNPLLKWSGDGASPSARSPPVELDAVSVSGNR